ncbi:hypothetical protein G6F31_017763 [Rhizopus arrhizus]|nr:hypothetical protein G6F31_017763 [Rhizopus arrhizus]
MRVQFVSGHETGFVGFVVVRARGQAHAHAVVQRAVEPFATQRVLLRGVVVAVAIAGLGADDLVGEDGRELAGQFPRLEERGPVDVVDQLRERIVVEHMQPGLVGHRRRIGVPAALELLPARMLQRDQALGVAAVAMARADLGVVGLVGCDERLAQSVGAW